MIFIVATFVLGYVADPIINLYIDPYSTITEGTNAMSSLYEEEDVSWLEHFVRGFASLGILGFAKFLITSPWQWWNLRGSGMMGSGGRTGATGRERMQQISWVAVLVGVMTVLYVSPSATLATIPCMLTVSGCLERRKSLESPDTRESLRTCNGCSRRRRR